MLILLCQGAFPYAALKQSRKKAKVGVSELVVDRLMPGEDALTMRSRDAEHWIAVYAEMIGFKRQVLDRVLVGLDAVSNEARTELSEDVELIQAQMHRYERRLSFWADRAGVLNGAGPGNGEA